MLNYKFENELLDLHVLRAKSDVPVGQFTLSGLNKLCGGIAPGRLIIISGEPGVAKTTLLGQLADDAAEQGFVSVVNTLEIAPYHFISKSIARLSCGAVAVNEIAGNIHPEVIEAATEKYRSTIAPNICFIDNSCTAIELGAVISKIQCERDQQVILFQDYLQIMPNADSKKIFDERHSIKETISGLRRVANILDVPVIAISSVNRTTYGKPISNLDSLGGSSAIEYSADTVLFLAVEGKGEERIRNSQQTERPLVVTALKNRYAPTGAVKLTFDTQHGLFSER